jgi:hypothetical protein
MGVLLVASLIVLAAGIVVLIGIDQLITRQK